MINEEAIKHSYEQFQGTGYTDSYETFKALLQSDPEALDHAFSMFGETGYTDDIEKFKGLMGVGGDPIKKKSEDDTESLLEDGSLDLQESDDKEDDQPTSVMEQLFGGESDDVPQIDGSLENMPEIKTQEELLAYWDNKEIDMSSLFGAGTTPEEGTLTNEEAVAEVRSGKYRGYDTIEQLANKPANAMMYEDGKPEMPEWLHEQYKLALELDRIESKKADKEMRIEATKERDEKINEDYAYVNTDEFAESLDFISPAFMGGDDREVSIKKLQDELGQHGISVRQGANLSDNIVLSTADGTTTMDMDQVLESSDVTEAARIKQWIKDHASDNKEVIEPIKDKALKAKQLRTGGRANSDGTTDSVNMVSYEEDGKFKVVPTLFPIDPKIQSTRADRWYDLSLEDAKAMALDRDEVFTFETQAEADAFAAGGYNNANTVQQEMKQLYASEGYDYNTEQGAVVEYKDIRDELLFIDNLGYSDKMAESGAVQIDVDNWSEEEREKYGHLVNSKGNLRSDLGDIRAALDAKEAIMVDVVFDDAKLEVMREKADVLLEKRYREESIESKTYNDEANAMLSLGEDMSQEMFGMTFLELEDYEPYTQEEVENKQMIVDGMTQAFIDKEYAIERYIEAGSYYDAKFQKGMVNDYLEGWSGTGEVIDDGLANGYAAEQILLIAMGLNEGGDDMSLAAEKISGHLNNVTGAETAAMGRYNKATGNREIFKAIDTPQDFGNWAIDLAASSMSMMLPYGSWLTGTAVVTGTGGGAALGSMGFITGPGGVVTTTGGAVLGAGQGLTLGMSATSLAMEYTNAVLDIAREKGYNPNDPASMQAALEDPTVWADGRERGLKRGIPIAMMDYISGGLAGKIFTAGKTASMAARVIGGSTERLVFDPVFEGLGEYAAQRVSGQEVNMKEIYAEMGGAIGSKTPNMAMNTWSDVRGTNTETFAKNMADPKFFGTSNERAGNVANWVDRNLKTGKITEEQATAIRSNIGRSRTAQTMLNENQQQGAKNTVVEGRIMELLEVTENTSSSTEAKADAKAEIDVMLETGMLSPEQQAKIKAEEAAAKQAKKDLKQAKKDIAEAEAKIAADQKEETRVGEEEARVELMKENDAKEAKGEAISEITEEAIEAKKDELGFEKQEQAVTEAAMEKLREEAKAEGKEGDVVTKEQIEAAKEEIIAEKVEEIVEERKQTEIEIEAEQDAINDFETLLAPETTEETVVEEDIQEEQIKVPSVEESFQKQAAENVVEVTDEATPKIKPLGEQTSTTEEQMNTEEATPKSTIIASTNLGNGYEFQANEPANTSIYRGGLENRHDQAGNYSPGRSIVITEKKAKDAVTKKQGLLRRTVEVSPAVEGEILIQARATEDSFGNRLKGSRGSSSVYSTVIVNPAEMEGMSESQKDAYLASVQQEVKADLKTKMDAIGNMEGRSEVEIINALNRVAQEADPKFQLEGMQEEVVLADVERIATEMNNMDAAEINFEEITPEDGRKAAPHLDGISDELAQELGFENAEAMTQPVENFENIPMFPAMSDMLSAGVTQDSMGNDMETNGGIHFNTKGKGRGLAWAGVNQEGAQAQVDKARNIYENNKALFDELWAEGKLPYGQIPMMVFRMGNQGVNSNEATLRWILPYIKSFGKKNQKAALEALIPAIQAKTQVKGKATVQAANALMAFIEDNKITKLDQLLEAIIEDADMRKVDTSVLTLPTKALFFDLIFGQGKTSNRPFITALNNGVKTKDAKFTTSAVYEGIGDKNMLEGKQGEGVAIQGVNVLEDSGVGRSQHENYAYGPKGGLIAFLSNPKHGLNMFSTWRAKQNRMNKTDVTGKAPSKENVVSQTGGAFFADSAFVGNTMTSKDSIVEQVVAKIRFAFPQVTVTTSKVEFDAMMNDPRVRKRLGKDGQVVYGVTMDGRIILNPDKATANTAIHEFGHIWVDYLSTAGGKKGQALLAQGRKLVAGTETHKRMIEEYGDTDIALEEAMVELLAVKGETIQNAAAKSKFKSWMNGMFKYIKEQFTASADLSMEEIENLTLEQFLETGLADMFSGKPLNAKFDPSKNEAAAEARFKKDSVSDLSIEDVLKKAIEESIPMNIVRAVLVKRGHTKSEIDANIADQMRINLIDVAPSEFGNVQEGSEAGRSLFAEIALKVAAEAKKATKRVNGLDPVAIRRFALDTLKASPLFQAQALEVQEGMVLGLDKHYNMRKGPQMNREVAALRAKLKALKTGPEAQSKQAVAKIQATLANFIRKALPVAEGFSVAQVQKILKNVIATQQASDILASVDNIMEVVEEQRAKMADTKRKAILKKVKNAAKTRKTESGKVKAKGLGADAQSFFIAAQEIMTLVMKGNTDVINKLTEEMKEKQSEIEALTEKEMNGETLTAKELKLLDTSYALEMFSEMMDMSVEDLTLIDSRTDAVLQGSRETLKAKRAARADAKAQLTEEADTQITETDPFLFDEDGNVLDANQRQAGRQAIWENIKNSGFIEKMKTILKSYRQTETARTLKTLNPFQFLKHLGTLTNALDRGGKFFTNNIYNALNVMDSNALGGKQKMNDRMNGIAQSFGFKNYRAFVVGLRGNITLSGMINSKTGKALGDTKLTLSQALRVYALSKNPVQMAKLEAQGIDAKTIAKIVAELGPNNIGMADATVEMLSNSYFDSINEVYKVTNDVALPYVENYFPTKTLADNTTNLLEGDFAAVFNAELADGLKSRSNTTDDVNIFDSGFVDTLDSHLTQMERFKAFAVGTKKMSMIVNLPSVKALLQETKTQALLMAKINAMINPLSIKKPAGMQTKLADFFMNAFVSYVLSNKLVQIPKQMSSFFNAFQEYTYMERTGEENIFQALGKEAVDMAAFLVESTKTYAQGRTNFMQAYNMSPAFRERVDEALKGNISQLETGQDSDSSLLGENTAANDAWLKFQAVRAATTTFGDILGVMGYMTTYNRNIKNGMSSVEALRQFEDYNATQQSKRASEKTALQENTNIFMRLMGAFTSTPQLLFNNVTQASLNIRLALTKGKQPSRSDVRKFYLNLGAAQMAFFATAHIAQFLAGGKDDDEELEKGLKDAASGMMLLKSLPAIGALVELATVDEPWAGDLGVNPATKFTRELTKMENAEPDAPFRTYLKGLELIGGFNLDPVFGAGETLLGTGDDEDMYDMFGISTSYQPGASSGSGKKSGKKGKTSEKKSKKSKK